MQFSKLKLIFHFKTSNIQKQVFFCNNRKKC